MDLLEHEGKRILREHGVAVPAGAIWPELPAGTATSWMVKAQVPEGRRGLRGGILRADSTDEVAVRAAELLSDGLSGTPVRSVYVEEFVPAEAELYLSCVVSRDRGGLALLANRAGGSAVDTDASMSVRVDIDPLIGLREFHLRRLVADLGLAAPTRGAVAALARTLVEICVAEDAELVEVNPVLVTPDGRLVAADAKITLDEDALFRHPERPVPEAWLGESAYHAACRRLGVVGVDLRGTPLHAGTAPDIAILTNGAGLSMATLDQVVAAGGRMAGVLELHGALARGEDHMVEVFDALPLLSCSFVLVHAFYQLASCAVLADALQRSALPPGSVIACLQGQDGDKSMAGLAAAGYGVASAIGPAAAAVVELGTRHMAEM